MKRAIIKIVIWMATFCLALFISGKVVNKENVNLTTDLDMATLPLITMEKAGIVYNNLYGYLADMDVSYQQESITELGDNRDISFEISTYGDRVDTVNLEVRSLDGERLIENKKVEDFETTAGKISIHTSLKDLIEKDTLYSLTILLKDGQGRQIRYYTHIIWSDKTNAVKKMEFVKDFHEKTLHKDNAQDLVKYMESNSKGDNTTLHKVNIHSSLKQLTYGDLAVVQEENERITITDLDNQTATIVVDFLLKSEGQEQEDTYQGREVYRVRVGADREYLLDYERTMTQIPVMEAGSFQGDKIRLGITEEDIQIVENENGSFIAYISGGNLYAYDLSNHRGTVVFSFDNKERRDKRLEYKNYDIKILNIADNGDISFAVYGYFNRGMHEGEVGLQVSQYHSKNNTIEEILYVPYEKSADILEKNLEKLLYLTEEGKLYFYLEQGIYKVDTFTRQQEMVTSLDSDMKLTISDSNKVVSWADANQLHIIYLDTDQHRKMSVQSGEKIFPMDFMIDDVIYGVVRESDIYTDQAGHTVYPMYKLCICDMYGTPLKTYEPDNLYIVSCKVDGNQITIEQVKKDSGSGYVQAMPEHIMSNEIQKEMKNGVSVVAIDVYEKFVQIKLKNQISNKALQILNPKWVVYEDNRVVEVAPSQEEKNEESFLYVYGKGGLQGIYQKPGEAISNAYDISGTVVDYKGKKIWLKGNRVTKNQIMAIKEKKCESGQSSLSVCLNTMLEFEGFTRNVEEELQEGKTALQILEEGMSDFRILDLEGCNLDAVLYYVNQDIPVLATVENGENVLVVGFNEFNVVIFQPSNGTLYKKGMNDSTEWFKKNGNKFIAYNRPE